MRLFFDTEFTGLHQNTTLISLGIIADNGETFYAEFNDFSSEQCNEWIQNNVINNLLHNKKIWYDKGKDNIADIKLFGDKNMIVTVLRDWLSSFEEVQLVSDVCHYDMVLLIDLFGSAFDLPENVSPCCYDINQLIAEKLGLTQREAFDKSREDILKELDIYIDGVKHNALYDAKVIKAIYDNL